MPPEGQFLLQRPCLVAWIFVRLHHSLSLVFFFFFYCFRTFSPARSFKNFLFIYFYFWLHWVFVAMCKLSRVAASRGYSLAVVCGFLTEEASLAVEHGL